LPITVLTACLETCCLIHCANARPHARSFALCTGLRIGTGGKQAGEAQPAMWLPAVNRRLRRAELSGLAEWNLLEGDLEGD